MIADLDLETLQHLADVKRARLATTIGAQGWLAVDNDPDLLVRELFRLARIGQAVELEHLHGTIGR